MVRFGCLVRETMGEMTATTVCAVLALAEDRGVQLWVDGGWAADACLGTQTGPHGDLDVVVEEQDLARFLAALAAVGYRPRSGVEPSSWRQVMVDDEGNVIDIRVIAVGDSGDGEHAPAQGGVGYPWRSLGGTGIISGWTVPCIMRGEWTDNLVGCC
jgi:lincosamide nucleotidyltransferase A/C/D/E